MFVECKQFKQCVNNTPMSNDRNVSRKHTVHLGRVHYQGERTSQWNAVI